MRNLFIALAVAAFGLAAPPAEAAFTAKKVDKAAAKGDSQKADQAAPAKKHKRGKGIVVKKNPK